MSPVAFPASANTDPNKLLGRPSQYIAKMNFNDKRIEPSKAEKQSLKEMELSFNDCTVEIFTNSEELETRRKYIAAFAKHGIFAQYIYVNKNALLRLDKKLTPEQAKEYETVFKSL